MVIFCLPVFRECDEERRRGLVTVTDCDCECDRDEKLGNLSVDIGAKGADLRSHHWALIH